MKKLALLAFSFFIICCNEVDKSNAYVVTPIDKKIQFALIEKWNNSDRIYIGTKTYNSLINTYKPLTFKVFNRGNLFKYLNTKFDSLFLERTKDTLMVHNYFYSTGQCWQYFPYIVNFNDTTELFCPEQITGKIEIINGDTTESTEGCATETIAELIVKIPIIDLKNTKIIKYKNKTIQVKY